MFDSYWRINQIDFCIVSSFINPNLSIKAVKTTVRRTTDKTVKIQEQNHMKSKTNIAVKAIQTIKTLNILLLSHLMISMSNDTWRFAFSPFIRQSIRHYHEITLRITIICSTPLVLIKWVILMIEMKIKWLSRLNNMI